MPQYRVIQFLEGRISSRRVYRRRGVLGLLLGVLVLLDSPYPFPIPLVGLTSVIVAFLIILPSLNFIYRGLRLPVQEALAFLSINGGQATKEELLAFLRGEGGGSGQELFDYLLTRDLVTFAHEDLDYVENHLDVADNILMIKPMAKNQVTKFLSGHISKLS